MDHTVECDPQRRSRRRRARESGSGRGGSAGGANDEQCALVEHDERRRPARRRRAAPRREPARPGRRSRAGWRCRTCSAAASSARTTDRGARRATRRGRGRRSPSRPAPGAARDDRFRFDSSASIIRPARSACVSGARQAARRSAAHDQLEPGGHAAEVALPRLLRDARRCRGCPARGCTARRRPSPTQRWRRNSAPPFTHEARVPRVDVLSRLGERRRFLVRVRPEAGGDVRPHARQAAAGGSDSRQ